MEQDLGVTVHSPVEFVVCFDGLVDANLVADDETWFGSSGDDEVAKIAVVRLDVALAGAEEQALETWISILSFQCAC